MLTIDQTLALALQHHQAGRLPDAEALYRQILAVQPEHPAALHYLGVIAHQQGDDHQARILIQKSLTLDPTDSNAHANLGETWRALGRLDEAIPEYHRALKLNPRNTAALSNLGEAYRLTGRVEEAVTVCREALEFRPEFLDGCVNLGNALRDYGALDEAAQWYRRALNLDPRHVPAGNNLGIILTEIGCLDESIATLLETLRWQGDYARAHSNLGRAFTEAGRYAEAVTSVQRALELDPKNDDARLNYSFLLLLHGEYKKAWPLYESRWTQVRSGRKTFPWPQWSGENIEGRGILIHTEQGLGDALQFVRYAPLVAARGAEVALQCQPSFAALFRGVPGISHVFTDTADLSPFDFHVPMLSLPGIFHTTPETIPADVPYLHAPADRSETWATLLGPDHSRLRIGLAWAGNPANREIRKKQIPLRLLAPLLELRGAQFFSLQLGYGSEQILEVPAASTALEDHTTHLHDFADTAALVANLDLVISIDTAVAHLAGALGRPIWTLLPFSADWRWSLARGDSAWYPTMRLFRQPALGDWVSVIQTVKEELLRTLATRAP